MMLHFSGKKKVKERQETYIKRKEKQKGDVNLLYFKWIRFHRAENGITQYVIVILS